MCWSITLPSSSFKALNMQQQRTGTELAASTSRSATLHRILHCLHPYTACHSQLITQGHALVTKAVLPLLKNAGGGSIVFQGSISSFLGQPNCATYAVMKVPLSLPLAAPAFLAL